MTVITAPRRTAPLVAYFALAFLISWGIAVPLALAKAGLIEPILPTWTHYLVAYGPALSALIVTWWAEGKAGLRELLRRIGMWRVPVLWWLVALSPLAVGLVVVFAMNTLGGSTISLADLGLVQFLPPLGGGALLLWLLTFGIGEEIGWRGFALPRLQTGRSALRATLILTVFWALWHLPAFFYLLDPAIAVGWLIGLAAGAVVFTWLFNSTGGSVLIVAVWHGCFNFVGSSDAGNGMVAAIASTIVMVWAVIVVLVFKPASLSHRGKATPGGEG